MMSEWKIVTHPDQLFQFQDIIDGYFPLQHSLEQMMERLGSSQAVVELSHAPIMDIPDLHPTSPVPLRVTKGQIGQIDYMALFIVKTEAVIKLCGYGSWRWFNSDTLDEAFDPLTRLAEPAFLSGYSFNPLPKDWQTTIPESIAKRVEHKGNIGFETARNELKPRSQKLLGPFGSYETILNIGPSSQSKLEIADPWGLVVETGHE